MLAIGAPLSDWLSWLLTLSSVEIDLGLERVQTMLRRLKPARPGCVLLIAGTNGKGSSVAMAAALLRAGGKRVGAFTSPHMHRYNERIVIDGVEASDAEIIAAFEHIESLRDGIPLTYFEYGTLAAIALFTATPLDVWILEVGLGGRLDATNAIEPDASLITNVALDHCDWLGDNVESIAREKAGVMRAGKPTVFGDRRIPDAITHTAADIGAILLRAGQQFDVVMGSDGRWDWRGPHRSIEGLQRPGLRGEFQIGNAAAVLALLDAAGLGSGIDAALIDRVFPVLSLPGRLQRRVIDRKEWLFDVAHNPAAAQVLATTLRQEPPQPAPIRTTGIIGLLDDKDVSGVISALQGSVDHWIALTADSPRAVPATELARRVANLCNKSCLIGGSPEEAIEFARRKAGENDRILVTGSFHTVGPVLASISTSQKQQS